MALERPLQDMGLSLMIWGRVLGVAMENFIIIFKVSLLISIGHPGSFIPGISIMKYTKYELRNSGIGNSQ